MSYQKKYWLDYKSLKVGDTKTYTLELWQNSDSTIIAEEIKGGQSPFILEMPELSHKFQVVRGRGATINLFSNTDMKFFSGLKHIDPKEFLVYHKIDGVTDWVGYLNSDMYSEPYDQSQNYIISTTANDGFSLMDRYRFLQEDETDYIGLKSKFELLQICLDKIGIPYNDIRISLSTGIADYIMSAYKTILHVSYVNCANFYDEDGLGMTIREVLESILAPYGAFICQDRGSIYITDINTMAGGGSILFKAYNSSTYEYSSEQTIVIGKDIYDINYFGTGQSIERSGGTNLQRVVYSPYPKKSIIDESIAVVGEFAVIPETFSTKITTGGYSYKYRILVGHDIWQTEPLSQTTFEESYGAISVSETEHYIYARFPMLPSNTKMMSYKSQDSHHLSIKCTSYQTQYWTGFNLAYRYNDGVAILITGKIYVRTKTNPYDESEEGIKTTGHQINYIIKIGDYYYNSHEQKWTTTPVTDNYILTTNNSEVISDEWIDLGFNGEGLLIPIASTETDILSGAMDFQIWANTKIQPLNDIPQENNSILKETWIRNIEFKLVNIDGTEIEDNDFENIGYLNKLFAQEGENITLMTGTAVRYTDLARIMKLEGTDISDIELWTRAGQTYKIEELLLNSLCSNYRGNYITLTGMRLKNEFSLVNVFTDTNFLEGNPKLMIKSSSIDYANYTHDVTLVEISEDELTIIKE